MNKNLKLSAYFILLFILFFIAVFFIKVEVSLLKPIKNVIICSAEIILGVTYIVGGIVTTGCTLIVSGIGRGSNTIWLVPFFIKWLMLPLVAIQSFLNFYKTKRKYHIVFVIIALFAFIVNLI